MSDRERRVKPNRMSDINRAVNKVSQGDQKSETSAEQPKPKPDYKQDFLVMGSAEQRVWELAVKLCMLRGHRGPFSGICEQCRREARIKLLDETVAKVGQ